VQNICRRCSGSGMAEKAKTGLAHRTAVTGVSLASSPVGWVGLGGVTRYQMRAKCARSHVLCSTCRIHKQTCGPKALSLLWGMCPCSWAPSCSPCLLCAGVTNKPVDHGQRLHCCCPRAAPEPCVSGAAAVREGGRRFTVWGMSVQALCLLVCV